MFSDEATSHQKGGAPMNYVGADYHKKYSHVNAIDEEGQGEFILPRKVK